MLSSGGKCATADITFLFFNGVVKMDLEEYLNKKEKISKKYNKIINDLVIWYPRSINDSVQQLQALGLPASEENLIRLPAGGFTIKLKVEQVAAAGRVLNKRMKYLNNSMPLEAYYYYINDYELFFSDKYDPEIFEELYFTDETIQENKEEFKKLKEKYFNKMYEMW